MKKKEKKRSTSISSSFTPSQFLEPGFGSGSGSGSGYGFGVLGNGEGNEIGERKGKEKENSGSGGKEENPRTEMYNDRTLSPGAVQRRESLEIVKLDRERERERERERAGSSMEIGSVDVESEIAGLRERRERLERAKRLLDGNKNRNENGDGDVGGIGRDQRRKESG